MENQLLSNAVLVKKNDFKYDDIIDRSNRSGKINGYWIDGKYSFTARFYEFWTIWIKEWYCYFKEEILESTDNLEIFDIHDKFYEIFSIFQRKFKILLYEYPEDEFQVRIYQIPSNPIHYCYIFIIYNAIVCLAIPKIDIFYKGGIVNFKYNKKLKYKISVLHNLDYVYLENFKYLVSVNTIELV